MHGPPGEGTAAAGWWGKGDGPETPVQRTCLDPGHGRPMLPHGAMQTERTHELPGACEEGFKPMGDGQKWVEKGTGPAAGQSKIRDWFQALAN